MSKTKIEWATDSWNPVTGCDPISEGCANCYAQPLAHRLKNMGKKKYVNGFKVTTHPEELDKPLYWKKPRKIFVCSMGDLFHEDVPGRFIHLVFNQMTKCPQHTFLILTKRPLRLASLAHELPWPPHIWAGVSVENWLYPHRIQQLIQVPAAIRFLSLEPLLDPMGEIFLGAIDWVIVGGESGPGARPMAEDWVVDIRDQCVGAWLPFFFKQWGGTRRKRAGRLLHGRSWEQMPPRV